MISPNTKIFVSKHAAERIIERFDRFIPPYGNHSELMIVISKMVRAGQHLTDWKRVPFYYNAISTKNGGPGTEFVSYNGNFVFICRYKPEEDVLVIVTVVTNMLYYPAKGMFAIGTAGGAKYVNEAKFLSNLENDAMIEYRERYGNTPKGVWARSPTVIEAGKNLQREQVKNSLQDKVDAIDRSLKGISSHTTAESLHIAKRKKLQEMKLHTVEDDVRMYNHLISIATYQVDRLKNEKAKKHLARYKAELQKLTVDKTEN